MADKPICVVVGVGPGIGLAVAKRFAEGDHTIVMLARRQSALNQYINTLNDMGAEGYAYPVDASDENSLAGVFTQVQDEIGAVNVLVYNVAAIKEGAPTQLTSQELQEDFKVNVNGALVSAQQVIPRMKERRSGTILLTGGGLSINPVAQYASLAAGKAALRNLAYTMHEELKPDGIHVATVTIGGYVEPGTRFAPDEIAKRYWDLYQQQPQNWQPEIVYE